VAISFIDAVLEANPSPSGSSTQALSAMPTHAAGDLLLFYCCCNGYGVVPQPPVDSDIVIFASNASSTLRFLVGYKIAASDSEVSGTWTNSTTHLGCVSYRGGGGNMVFPAAWSTFGGGAGSGQNITYPAVADLSKVTGEKWFAGLVQHRQTNTDVETAPSGMTNRGSANGSVGEFAMHDSNGDLSSWPLTNYTLTAGTSSSYIATVVSLVEIPAVGSGGGNIIVIED